MRLECFFGLTMFLLSANVVQATNPQDQPKKAPQESPAKAGTAGQKKIPPDETIQPSDATTKEANLPTAAFSPRVIEVLHTTAADAAHWENKIAAAKTQAAVADLTWESAPPIARGYLMQAWETAGKIKEEKSATSVHRNVSRRTETQRAVLLIARKRAPSLAEKWLEALANETQRTQRENSEDKKSELPQGVFDNRTVRSSILLGMALSLVAENPAVAAELASASLQDGISFELQAVLLALQDQSFEFAQTVFRAALARIRLAGINDPNELLTLHAYLFTPGRVRVAGSGDRPGSFQLAVGREEKKITAAAKLKPELAAEFLHLAAEALLRLPLPSATANPLAAARAQLNAIRMISGDLAQVAPEQAAALQVRAQNLSADARFAPPPVKRQAESAAPRAGESQQEYEERRVDTLEELAKQETNPLSRDIAFAKAALATQAPAYERGWRLAAQIRDQALRAGVSNWLTYRASLHFINLQAFDKARQELIGKNEDLVQRGASLIVGAQKLLADKNQLQAREWLQEASSLLDKLDKEAGALSLAFGLVSAYGTFDRSLALNALANAVKLLNQWPSVPALEEKAPPAKRFAGLPVADFTYGTKGFSPAGAAAVFLLEEFEIVLGLLQELKHPEIKGHLIVNLCQQHLKAKRQPPGVAAKSAPPTPTSN